ncbi:MAG: hypothetical protein M1816_003308 [Peltula sp. TS41687]|nr:MAG: hypothetical protein M1816_003308 [Peltula sp. TS41687]
MANQNTNSNVSWTRVGHDDGSSTLYYGPDMTSQPGHPGITYRTPQQPLTTSTTTTQANPDDERWVILGEVETVKQATEIALESLEAMAPRHVVKKSLFLIKLLLPDFKQRIHHTIANPQITIGVPSPIREIPCYVHDDHGDRLREIYCPSHDERFNDNPRAFLYGIRAETHDRPLLPLPQTYHRNHASIQDGGKIGHETTIIDLTKHWYKDYREPSPTEDKGAIESRPWQQNTQDKSQSDRTSDPQELPSLTPTQPRPNKPRTTRPSPTPLQLAVTQSQGPTDIADTTNTTQTMDFELPEIEPMTATELEEFFREEALTRGSSSLEGEAPVTNHPQTHATVTTKRMNIVTPRGTMLRGGIVRTRT